MDQAEQPNANPSLEEIIISKENVIAKFNLTQEQQTKLDDLFDHLSVQGSDATKVKWFLRHFDRCQTCKTEFESIDSPDDSSTSCKVDLALAAAVLLRFEGRPLGDVVKAWDENTYKGDLLEAKGMVRDAPWATAIIEDLRFKIDAIAKAWECYGVKLVSKRVQCTVM